MKRSHAKISMFFVLLTSVILLSTSASAQFFLICILEIINRCCTKLTFTYKTRAC
jgi:hypothetical protein